MLSLFYLVGRPLFAGADLWPDFGSAVKDPVTPHRKRDPAIVDGDDQDDEEESGAVEASDANKEDAGLGKGRATTTSVDEGLRQAAEKLARKMAECVKPSEVMKACFQYTCSSSFTSYHLILPSGYSYLMCVLRCSRKFGVRWQTARC